MLKILGLFEVILVFFFEDLNGDFHDLFHGTQNIDGQVHVIIMTVNICVDMTEKFLGK